MFREGHGTLGKLVTDESVYNALKRATYEADSSLKQVSGKFTDMANVVADLSTSFNRVADKADSVLSNVNLAVKNLDTTSSDIKLTVSQIDTGGGLVASLIHNRSVYDTALEVVSTTLSAVKEAQLGLQRFAENMEALRHNWLFSSYFSQKTEDEYTIKEKQLEQLEAQIKDRAEFLDKMEKQIREIQQKLNKSGGGRRFQLSLEYPRNRRRIISPRHDVPNHRDVIIIKSGGDNEADLAGAADRNRINV